MTFSDFSFSTSIQNLIKYETPFPVQELSIPPILEGKDALVIAPTGSGKTDCFLLPILEKSRNIPSEKNRSILSLILVPTRELAIQIGDLLHTYCDLLKSDLRSKAVYGGVSINPQMKSMFGVHILVATPGRLIELIKSNAVQLNNLETFVMDEADKLLNLGFEEELDVIINLLPKKRQNLLFSATLNERIDGLQKIFLRNPVLIELQAEENETDILIDQIAYYVDESRKGPLLRYLIKNHTAKQVLIFTSSKDKADKVSNKLNKNGLNSRAIHGNKSQGNRRSTLDKFKKGELPILVTTDLLSRGIDIEFLPLVINYELPRSPKDYIHRIGRTGRAENKGKAISLISDNERQHFKVIQKKMNTWTELIDSTEINLHGY